MKSIDSLKKLYQTSVIIPEMQFISNENELKIQKAIEQVENIFVAPILEMLFNNEHKKLVTILEKTKPESPLYNFVNFAAMLCADETDFDELTKPLNNDFYKKLQMFSEKFQKPVRPYISILEKICDNKGLGLYSEFQEVEFFFQEIKKSEEKDFKSTFKDFKRILTLQTQRIFSEFIKLNIFSYAQKILNKNRDKIENENAFVSYIFGNLFFNLHLSNQNENLLIKHIEFYIQYLTKNEFIRFEKIDRKKYFIQLEDLTSRISFFFNSNEFSGDQKSIALLKDYTLNNEGVLQFTKDFQRIQNGETVSIEKTSHIEQLANTVFQMDKKNDSILLLQLIFLIAESESVDLEKIENARALYRENIIQNIRKIFNENRLKISDADTLCFYVYAELYFNHHPSNEKEILLYKYIKIFIASLVKRGLRFETASKKHYFIQYQDLEQRLRILFENENITGKTKVIPYLKDYSLNDTGIIEFCKKLQTIFDGKTVKIDHTNSLATLKDVINSMHPKNDALLFLKALFTLDYKTNPISIAQIEIAQSTHVFEDLIKGHFESPYSDIQLLNSYKSELGDNFDAIQYLFTKRRKVFYQIIECYQKNITENKTIEKLSKEYSDFTNTEKLKEILSLLYSIITKKLKLKIIGTITKNGFKSYSTEWVYDGIIKRREFSDSYK